MLCQIPEFFAYLLIASYSTVAMNELLCLKCMQKSPDFDATYDPIVSNQKVCKKVQILMQIKAIY